MTAAAPINVFIDGAQGTTGLRLHQRLSAREDVVLLSIDPERRKDPEERARISGAADVVFLCLPNEASRESASRIGPDVVVIDASTEHRTQEGWAYGFPELSSAHREKIAASRRIANPGCHASGFLALAYPILAEGIAPPDYPFAVHSVTGYSGGGKPMIAKYEGENRPDYCGSPRQYALGQAHKHLPEMQKISGAAFPPQFSPILADFYAGMVVTVPLHTRLLRGAPGVREIHAFFARYYGGQKLVRVREFGAESALEDEMMDAGALAGLDYMEIFVCGNDEQVLLIARFDNLGKGASGAAIQCMNLACGREETAGLCL